MSRNTPFADESLNGFIARVAAADWIDRMIDLTGPAGVEYGHQQSAPRSANVDMSLLADILGSDEAELLLRQHLSVAHHPNRVNFFGHTIHKNYLQARIRHYARGSLAQSLHHRALWTLNPITFCPESWELLETTCPREFCKATQGWSRTIGIDLCDSCTANLKDGPVHVVPVELRCDLEHVTGLIHPDPSMAAKTSSLLPKCLQGFNNGALFQTLLTLVKVSHPEVSKSRITMKPEAAQQLNRALAKAWQALASWPDGGAELLLASLERNRERRCHSQGARNRTSMSLKAHYSRTPQETAVLSLMLSKVDTAGPNQEEIDKRTVGIKEASRITGHGTKILASLRDKDVFRTHYIIDRNGRGQIAFDRQQILDIRKNMEERYSAEKVRLTLGIPYYAVGQLIKNGTLKQLTEAFFQETYNNVNVQGSSIDRLIDDLQALPPPPEGVPLTNLSEAMHSYGGGLKPWGRVLHRIRFTELPCFWADLPVQAAPAVRVESKRQLKNLAKQLMLPPTSLDTIYGLPPEQMKVAEDENLLLSNVADACEILNINLYVKDRIFADLNRKQSHVNYRFIPLSRILEVASTRVGALEAGRRSKTDYQSVERLLRKAGVKRLDQAGYDRQAFDAWLAEYERSA